MYLWNLCLAWSTRILGSSCPPMTLHLLKLKTMPHWAQKRKKRRFHDWTSFVVVQEDTYITILIKQISQIYFFYHLCHNKSWSRSWPGRDPYSATGWVRIRIPQNTWIQIRVKWIEYGSETLVDVGYWACLTFPRYWWRRSEGSWRPETKCQQLKILKYSRGMYRTVHCTVPSILWFSQSKIDDTGSRQEILTLLPVFIQILKNKSLGMVK